MLKRVFFIALTFVIGFHTHAQLGGPGGGGSATVNINGPSSSFIGDQETYTVSVSGGTLTSSTFYVNNGTVISQSLSSITVQWNGGSGQASIGLQATVSGNVYLANKAVDVTLPPPVPKQENTKTTTSFKARWFSVSGASSYRLDVSTNENFTSFISGFNDKNVSGTSRVVSGLNPGTRYYYRVRTRDTYGNDSPNSTSIIANTKIDPPVLSAETDITYESFTLNWSAVTNANDYRLEVATDAGFTNLLSGYNDLNVGNVTTYTVENLNPETTYHYRVRTKGPHYYSTYATSQVQTAAPPPSNVIPSIGENFVRVELAKVPVTTEGSLSILEAHEKNTSVTYSDGLGRSILNIEVESGPNYEDIVQYQEYDPTTGLTLKSYLPYAKSTGSAGEFVNNGDTQTQNFYSSTPSGVTGDTHPYSLTTYDGSPLARNKTTLGPGQVWHSGDKKVETNYLVHEDLNNVDDIPKWVVNGSSPSRSGDYGTGEIMLTESIDENGDRVQFGKDGMDNTIIKRVWDGTKWLATLYVHDIFGRLRFIIPPKISGQSSLTSDELDGFVFQYAYDKYGNVIREKTPGADWKEMVYDDWNRLVLSQDGVQRAQGYWMFSKYDADNRVIMTGRLNSTQTRSQLAADVLLETTRYETIDPNSDFGYTDNTTYPNSYTELYSVTYYDSYHFIDNAGWDTDLAPGAFDYQNTTSITLPANEATSVKGQVTGSKVKVLGTTNEWLNTVTYYDDRMRQIQTITENHLDGFDRASSELTFDGKALKMLLEHEGTETLDLLTTYEYDHRDRLIAEYLQIDALPQVQVADYRYNALGELVEKNVHSTDGGTSFLQSEDYRYNIRGWLTSINNSELTNDGGATNDDANDLFGMEYVYTSGSTVGGQAINARFDGSPSVIKWKGNTILDGAQDQMAYGFSYDQVNRLTGSYYATEVSGNFTGNSGHFNTSVQYDDNGNIQDLTRNASNNSIDNLDYTYEPHSNKLIRVEDNAPSGNAKDGFDNKMASSDPVTEYHYDENGNLTFDGNKDIQTLSYNELNLVDQIVFYDGTQIDYVYDAAGVKLSKEVTNGSGQSLGKIDYAGSIEYLDNELNQFYTSEGRVFKQNDTFFHEYFIKDHQENNRLSYGILPERNVYVASMESEKSTYEESIFDFASLSRNTAENHTPLGNESIALNGTIANQQVGPAKVLDIQDGDVVSMEVFAKYNYQAWNNTTIANITSLVASTFGGASVGTGAEGAATSLQNALNDPVAAGLFADNMSGEPEAYLQYVFFDDSYNYVSTYSGFIAVGGASDGNFAKMESEITINQSGYLFIYLANESNQNADVFFDDLKVIHESAQANLKVSQLNHYYPFGLRTESSWSHPGYIDPGQLYQSSFATLDSITQYYEFDKRMYDPILGRFMATDPANQYSNPYLGMGNQPHAGTDPDGATYYSSYRGFSFLGGLPNFGMPIEQTDPNNTNQVVSHNNDGVLTDEEIAAAQKVQTEYLRNKLIRSYQSSPNENYVDRSKNGWSVTTNKVLSLIGLPAAVLQEKGYWIGKTKVTEEYRLYSKRFKGSQNVTKTGLLRKAGAAGLTISILVDATNIRTMQDIGPFMQDATISTVLFLAPSPYTVGYLLLTNIDEMESAYNMFWEEAAKQPGFQDAIKRTKDPSEWTGFDWNNFFKFIDFLD